MYTSQWPGFCFVFNYSKLTTRLKTQRNFYFIIINTVSVSFPLHPFFPWRAARLKRKQTELYSDLTAQWETTGGYCAFTFLFSLRSWKTRWFNFFTYSLIWASVYVNPSRRNRKGHTCWKSATLQTRTGLTNRLEPIINAGTHRQRHRQQDENAAFQQWSHRREEEQQQQKKKKSIAKLYRISRLK